MAHFFFPVAPLKGAQGRGKRIGELYIFFIFGPKNTRFCFVFSSY